jgi:hypothetical protein
LLRPQLRVRCRERYGSRFFLCASPDRARASNQRERIVANDFGRAFQFELDASFANGRMTPNSSVTRKTTRVESGPSAFRSKFE